MNEPAPSTIAYTIYNAICVYWQGPIDSRVLLQRLRERWWDDLRVNDFRKGIEALATRGLVRVDADDRVDSTDPHRRALVRRERSGDGWGGWEVEAVPGRVRRMAAAHEHHSIPIEDIRR